MCSKRGQFLPIRKWATQPYSQMQLCSVCVSCDSMAWRVLLLPIRRQSSGYHSTVPPITQARPLGEHANVPSERKLRTPTRPSQPDFFFSPSSRSVSRLSHPSHANIKFPSLLILKPSSTFCFHPRHVCHSTPDIFCFLRGKIRSRFAFGMCGAGLARIGIRHSGKQERGLQRGETGKRERRRDKKELPSRRKVANTTNQFRGADEQESRSLMPKRKTLMHTCSEGSFGNLFSPV
jgi:hypothetical protein